VNGASETEKQSPPAKRSLGQHFLRDPNIARKIVGLLRITAEDSVLEIGPGPGALTRFIAEHNPARLLVVEKDAHWAEATAHMLAAYGLVSSTVAEGEVPRVAEGGNPRAREAKISRTADTEIPRAAEPAPVDARRLRVLQADALTLPFEHFSPGWKIIGNLPYNIASPLLWELFSRMPSPARAVFMLQKEVGLRLTAAPGSRAYGALSVWLQSFIRPRTAFVVPPHVFHPRPKVDSMVLVFEQLVPRPADNEDPERLRSTADRLFAPADVPCAPADVPRITADVSCAPANPPRAPADPADSLAEPPGASVNLPRASGHLPCSPAELAAALHACFRMRRKQMGSIAAARGIAPHRLEALGISVRSRPENLTPEEFQRLAAARLFV
jgi:16S rRNA (adenine1518-N6/adenine1519-N6)-dimethyltransferase